MDAQKVYVVKTTSQDYYTRDLSKAEAFVEKRQGATIKSYNDLDSALAEFADLQPLSTAK